MHSLIAFEDQMAAFTPGGGGDMRTRVIIATNIAESSVTLPGEDGEAEDVRVDQTLLVWGAGAFFVMLGSRVCLYLGLIRPAFPRCSPDVHAVIDFGEEV